VAAGILVIDKALAQVPPRERAPLLRRLISLEIDAGLMRSARRRLGELRKAKAEDLWVYEMAADLAILAEDEHDLKECEDELEALEGPTGSYWRYYRAVRLLTSERDDLEAVRQANPLLTAIQAIRPSWPPTRLLRGRIAERMGRVAEAADNYEIALRSGSRNLTAFQWLVATLYRQNRFADAAAYIRQVGQIATLSGELSPQAVPANLKAGRIDEALRVAIKDSRPSTRPDAGEPVLPVEYRSRRPTVPALLIVPCVSQAIKPDVARILGETLQRFEPREIPIDPGRANPSSDRLTQARVGAEHPAARGDAVRFIVKSLGKHGREIRDHPPFEQLRMQCGHPVGAVRPDDGEMRHADSFWRAFFDQAHACGTCGVVREPRPHDVQEAAVDLVDDVQLPRQEQLEPRQGPLLERFGQQRVIRIAERARRQVPGLVPFQPRFV
jgi:tetratricopeptide (TPR) repeat protein